MCAGACACVCVHVYVHTCGSASVVHCAFYHLIEHTGHRTGRISHSQRLTRSQCVKQDFEPRSA